MIQRSERYNLKVLVCSSEYYPYFEVGGIARVAAYVTRKLEQKGVDCDVCSPHGPDIKIGCSHLQFSPRVMQFGYLRRFIFWFIAMNFLRHIIDKYDVVWLHNPIFFYNLPTSNFVVTIHGFLPEHYEALKYMDVNFMDKVSYLLASRLEFSSINKLADQGATFSVVCPNTKFFLSKIGINKDKIKIIPNGVNIRVFKPRKNKKDLRKKLGLPEEHILLLFVGRMTEQKRPHLLLNFFSRVVKECSEITLVMVGKGPLLNDLKNFAIKNDIRNVMFLGYVPDSLLPLVYSSCDIFIMSSAYEGNPLSLLEAFSSGLPCVVQNISSLRAIVNEIDSGLVLSMENDNATQIFLKYLYSKQFKKDSKKSRKYAENNLSLNRMVLKYQQLFEQIKTKKRP